MTISHQLCRWLASKHASKTPVPLHCVCVAASSSVTCLRDYSGSVLLSKLGSVTATADMHPALIMPHKTLPTCAICA